VYLVPGVGMITFAKDKATARISGEFYVNAKNVMRHASAVSTDRKSTRLNSSHITISDHVFCLQKKDW